jgi:hypothetical protein
MRKQVLLNSKYQGHNRLKRQRTQSGPKKVMPKLIVGRGSKVKKLPSGINVISHRAIARKPASSSVVKLAQLAKNMTNPVATPKPAKLASAVDVFTFANNLNQMFHWE